MGNQLKFFVGYEGESKGGWFIQRTNDYRINSHKDYITNKGNFSSNTDKYSQKQVFDSLEDAQNSIMVNQKGYVRIII